ncbi:LysM peptidoglycan-binding domain-containing protein [Candidatus Poribacteria bacterium]|nr:LysM peptidoglycan-binding domain-containing protein [Candidatus Poribacteria bacterium]MYB66306.1 LysM peptidoglycan-binding domain-containing protein [Candidatus Poribacteria bacterium]
MRRISMNMIKSTLKLAMILYICVALTGVYALSASAKITPRDDSDEETTLITIEKGDTLWDLCQEHLKDPLKWRELSKYNDFTNPDLIYPGEKLRIPIAMAKNVAEMAEEEVKVKQEELEKLRTDLAESEAERDKLMAEIKGLNDSMAELKKKIGELEASQKSQEKVIEAVNKANTDTANDVKRTVRNARNSLQEKLDTLNGNLDFVKEMLSAQQKELKATQDNIKTVQADVKTALAHIETNQKGIAELKRMIVDAQGVHEEVSSNKRAIVFITTVAAGIGLFVLNTIGGRGE